MNVSRCHRNTSKAVKTSPTPPGESHAVTKGPSAITSSESTTDDVTSETNKGEAEMLRDLLAFGSLFERRTLHSHTVTEVPTKLLESCSQ